MCWMKTIAMTAALSMAALSLPATAQAGHYGHGYGYSKPYYGKTYFPRRHFRGHRHRHSNNSALAAGIFGLAAGAIIGGALAQPRYPRSYYYSEPVYGSTYAAPVYGAPMWSPEWYAKCASKYRSFDPHSGTFQPYNGPRRLCQ
jgi:hypothetical protein